MATTKTIYVKSDHERIWELFESQVQAEGSSVSARIVQLMAQYLNSWGGGDRVDIFVAGPEEGDPDNYWSPAALRVGNHKGVVEFRDGKWVVHFMTPGFEPEDEIQTVTLKNLPTGGYEIVKFAVAEAQRELAKRKVLQQKSSREEAISGDLLEAISLLQRVKENFR